MKRFRSAALLAAAGLTVLVFSSAVQARVDSREKDWVSLVVSKISEADRRAAGTRAQRGVVTIRVRVASDGSLEDVAIEQGSGTASLDERALQAVRAAAPFKPPPAGLLSLDGSTELSFPLELRGRSSN